MQTQGIPQVNPACSAQPEAPPAHLHPGNQQQLLFDAQEHRVEGQVMGQLVQAAQGRSRRRQQVVVTGAFLLTHRDRKTFIYASH